MEGLSFCDILYSIMRAFHRRFRSLPFSLLLFFFVLSNHAFAQSIRLDSLDFHLGETLIVNGFTEDAEGEPVQGSDVSPLTFTMGGGARFAFPGGWRAGLSVDLWTQEYLETPQGPVVPTQIETGSAAGESLAKTIGLVVGLPFFYHWEPPATGDFHFGGGISPSFVFRLPYSGIDGAKPDGVREYYLSEGRFFYPETMLYGEYVLNERLRFGLHIRALWPLYNSWDGEDTAALDEMLLSFLLGVRWVFPE